MGGAPAIGSGSGAGNTGAGGSGGGSSGGCKCRVSEEPGDAGGWLVGLSAVGLAPGAAAEALTALDQVREAAG